jgi:hypothetical protein
MMQYQPDVLAPERRRPGTVLVAGMLLFLVAASSLVSVFVTIATWDRQQRAVSDLLDTSGNNVQDPNVVSSAAQIGLGVQVAISAIIMILFVLLAIFNLRGVQGMRVTAWVLAGIGVVCTGFGVIGSAVASGNGFATSVTDANGNRVDLNSLVPQWQRDLATTQYVVVLLALIVIIILLALPPSNEWFRKPSLVYPMVGGIGYGIPGYAQYPGQAYPAQPPGYPADYPVQAPPPTPTDSTWPPAP